MVSEGVKFENMDKRTEADARNRSALGKRLSTTEISGVQGSPRGKFSTPIGKISTIVTRGSSGFFGGQSSFSRDTSRRPLATIVSPDDSDIPHPAKQLSICESKKRFKQSSTSLICF